MRMGVVMCLLLLAGGVIEAAAPLEVGLASGRWYVSSNYPVPATVLVRGRRSAEWAYETVTVTPGSGRVWLPWGSDVGDVKLMSVAILDGRVGIPETAGCPRSLQFDLSGLQNAASQVERAVNESRISESAEGRRAIELTKQATVLSFISFEETIEHDLSDPARLEARSALAEVDPVAAQSQEAGEGLARGVTLLMGWMSGTAEVMDAKQQQWTKEAQLMKPLVEKLRHLKDTMTARTKDLTALEVAGRHFGTEAAARLTGSADEPYDVRELCGANAVHDVLYVSARSGSTAAGPILLELQFDRGGKAVYPAYPATPHRTGWQAVFFWPVVASKATVSLVSGGNVRRFAEVQAARRPPVAELNDFTERLSAAEKRLRKARWAGEGKAAQDSVITY
jgi:hypothetical protein